MTTIMRANAEWTSRPADQRFTSLPDLMAAVSYDRDTSLQTVVSSRKLAFRPTPDAKGLVLQGRHGEYAPTHHAFGQLAQLAAAPAGYLRTLPAPMAADCLNYGMRFSRDVAEVGLLMTDPDSGVADNAWNVRAATGPNYGRIWNSEIVETLMHRFGDGVSGDFKVPGEFGKDVPITKENTTIYGGEKNIFVFLADEKNKIQIANRRDGQAGAMSRGFFVWNSEVASDSLGVAFFNFDYVCKNRIVWGAEGYKEIRLRHTAGAPDRWLEEVTPVLMAYSEASALPIERTIAAAQEAKIQDDLTAFLSKRFTKSETAGAINAHLAEEGRPIETIWDAVTGLTAHARQMGWQDERVGLERRAGALLDLVAV